ncbi:BMP family ABC transporter substrate-binding protein [Mycoplasmopsis agalactiae]|nr:BMP family ABC transporter substrate-binding protein [Mycoplasmopsis agalactiae]UUM25685.1 BMP family ABC transporter substrate-binding protein [Mycoplasmopsis agalactiae]
MLWGGGITSISLLPLIAAKCDNKSGNWRANQPNDRAVDHKNGNQESSNLIAPVLEKEYFQILNHVYDTVQILKKTHGNNPKTRELDEILSSIYQPKKLEKTLDYLTSLVIEIAKKDYGFNSHFGEDFNRWHTNNVNDLDWKVRDQLNVITDILDKVKDSIDYDKHFKISYDGNTKTITTLANIKSQDNLKLRSGLNTENTPKTAFIADGVSVYDESFNQSAWEAVHKISYELGLDKAKAIGNKELRNKAFEPGWGQLTEAYKNAIDAGFKYIVLCGFMHQTPLVDLDDNYIKKIKDNNIVFITVDFDVLQFSDDKSKAFIQKIGEGHLIPVIFDVKQAAYIAGRALADYFSQVYKDQPEKRTIGAFGGIPYPAVSDFIAGTFQGIIDWNKEHPEAKTKSLNETIELNTLSTSGALKATTAINSAVKATAAYPVAGSLSIDTAKEIKKIADKDKFIIGVDEDQKNKLKGHRIFTSVMKLIGQAVYNILADLYTKGESNITLQPGFEIGKKNGTPLPYGYGDSETEKYVGVATSGLLDDINDELANKSLKNAIAYYENHKSEIQERLKNQEETVKKELKDQFPTNRVGDKFQKVIDWLAAETRK